MGKQTLGGAGMPRNWGAPSPVFNYETGKYESGGMVWAGKNRTTAPDKKALKARFGNKVKIDGPTTRGKLDPKYSTFNDRASKKKAYKQVIVAKG
jgi:hypothetical protein